MKPTKMRNSEVPEGLEVPTPPLVVPVVLTLYTNPAISHE